MTRGAFSLIEVLVALAVVSVLALPFAEMILSSKRKVEGLPRRLCALYYAQDLMVERLGKTAYANVRAISKRKMSEFVWNRDNVFDMAASETGDRRKRIRSAIDFLALFDAEVAVTEEVPNRRKRVKVVVSWYEAGHPESVDLVSVVQQ